MKKLLFTFAAVSLMCICAFAGNESPKWNLFNLNMKLAMQSSNPGVQLDALKLIIRYSDKLSDTDFFFDAAKEFNACENREIRKAALIALYKLDPDKAVAFYSLQQNREQNDAIRGKMTTIISAHQKDAALADLEVNKCYEICHCCNFLSFTY